MQADETHRARQAIRDVLEAYFNACDRQDEAAIAACFTPSVEATYQAGTPIARTTSGAAAVAAELMRAMAKVGAAVHTTGNVTIVLQGGKASSITFAVAQSLREGRVIVRGLRYDDALECADGTWRIARRVHRPLWQDQAAATPV